MDAYRKVLRYAWPYRKAGLLNIGFNILYAVFNVLSILVFIPTLGILFDSKEPVTEPPIYQGLGNLQSYAEGQLNFLLTQKTAEDGPLGALLFICLLSLAIFFLKNLFRYAAMYFLAFLRTGMVRDIQDGLYEKTLALSVGFFTESRKGDLLARMTADVKEVEGSIINSLEAMVREPITIAIVLFSMLSISPSLTLFVLIFLPVTGFIISAVGKRLKTQSLEAQRENGVFLSFLEETLGGSKIIKAFGAEAAMAERFKASTGRFRKIMLSVLQRKGLASPLSEFLGVAVVITVLWYGGSLVLGEQRLLAPEQFLGYIGLFYTIINPVKAITTVNYNLKKGNAAAERILEIIEIPPSIQDREDALDKATFERAIRLEGVGFGYTDDLVLSDFDLEVPKGKTVALVGQSGSGKSTVAQLVARFYDVGEGAVRIDGTDVRDLKQGALRSLIGLVTQESILFNDTVHQNIALGVPGADRAAVVAAAKVANAHEFIEALPQGYDTPIGDGGNRLSGGQRQRLSIARAVLKDPQS